MTIKKYEQTKTCDHELTEFEFDNGCLEARCWRCDTTFEVNLNLKEVEICDSCEYTLDKCDCYICDKHNSRCIEYKRFDGEIRYRYPDVYEDYCEACACDDCHEMPQDCKCKPKQNIPKTIFMNTTMDDVMKCFKIDFKGM